MTVDVRMQVKSGELRPENTYWFHSVVHIWFFVKEYIVTCFSD
jgi:hypothetical protein